MDVRLPDGTVVNNVPDGTTKAQLAEKLRANGRQVPQDWLAPPKTEKPSNGVVTNYPPLGVAEATMNLATGAVAKPISDVAGLAATGKELISPSPGGGDPAGFSRSVKDALTYEPRTNAGKLAAKYNPLSIGAKVWGSGAKAIRNLIAPPKTSSPARDAFGNAIEEGINQAPQVLGGKVPEAAGAASEAMKGGARELMQSALKPDKAALETGKAASAVDTLLERGINVSPGGVRTLQARVDDINSRIKNVIANSPATIDKQTVGYYAQQAADKFKDQVNATSDLAAIQRSWDEFLDNFPDKIPIQQAQAVKQGTYRSLGDKSYGELKGAEKEAQKALARGLKEEIARAAPEVRPLNAEESQLLNALNLTERRVLISANKNPMGLAWFASNKEKFAAFMADRSELFKSLVARMLYSTSGAVPPGAAAVPAAGAAVTSQADRNKPISQLPPDARNRRITDMPQ